MKGFTKYGKLMGLMLLAMGLLFAGCQTGSSSSDEGPVSSPQGTSDNWVPMEMTADGNLIIGDGSGSATATIDGHLVEITSDGNTACSGGDPSSCWVRVINRDPDMYMSNVILLVSDCADCTSAQILNADVYAGSTTHLVGTDGSAGVPSDLNTAGWCVVEDGEFYYPTPHNAYGCDKHANPSSSEKPYQILHPDCGARAVKIDFGNQAGNYGFYATVSAEWTQWRPVNDDTNGDITNFPATNIDPALTTHFIMLTDIDDKMTAVNKAWYDIGSYKRSTVLAGWSSAGNVSGVTMSESQYFGVNIAIEYADRIENQVMAAGDANPDFEYYTGFAFILRYDPFTVNRITSAGRVRTGGTMVTKDFQRMCAGTVECSDGKDTYTGFQDPSVTTGYNDADGYVFGYMFIEEKLFGEFGAGDSYMTVYGDHVTAFYSYVVPKHWGHKGCAHVNMTPSHGIPGMSDYLGWISTAVIQDPADPEPEMPYGFLFFKVKPGTAGRGSEFWTDQFGTYDMPILAHSGHTYKPSGKAVGTDDWLSYCWPMTPGYDNGTDQGCDGVVDTELVSYGNEQSNPDLKQSGQAVQGGGMYQSWNVHICVQ